MINDIQHDHQSRHAVETFKCPRGAGGIIGRNVWEHTTPGGFTNDRHHGSFARKDTAPQTKRVRCTHDVDEAARRFFDDVPPMPNDVRIP